MWIRSNSKRIIIQLIQLVQLKQKRRHQLLEEHVKEVKAKIEKRAARPKGYQWRILRRKVKIE